MDTSQQDHAHHFSNLIPLNSTISVQEPDIFAFLKTDEEKHSRYPSFFSENGLSQDIIQVTQAEPDICLEAFYALYNTLWPQIESQSDVSFRDAWINFIGGSITKGSLCPPEKLIIERRVKDIKRNMSRPGGENQIFQYLDEVLASIYNLKQKIDDDPGEILFKKQVIESLSLVEEFYQSYRNKVKGLVQAILEKEKMNAPYASESDALEDLLEPKAIIMSDIFVHHWAYRISRTTAQRLLSLDASGRNLKSHINDPSNHRVVALPENTEKPLVFFKANGNPPIQPEKEFMIYSLYQYLQIPVPETALLVLTDVFEANPEYFYAVQASEAVIGESSLKACQDQETTFDQEAYASQTIGAFLTNPSDGSFKNFKYSFEYKALIGIDNDEIFKPELTGSDDKKIVNVKSILYLLPHIDLPIPEPVKTSFTTLNPRLIAFAWLQDLSRKNKEYSLLFAKLTFQKTRCIYQNLLPQSEVPSLSTCLEQKVQVDHDLHNDPFSPQIHVSQNLLMSTTEKLQIIEKILLNNRSVSTQMLFEEISPLLGKYYRKLRLKFNDPEETLEALWGNKKNRIDYSYISSLLDHEELSNLLSNKNELNENLSPETFFKEFQDLLASESSPLDGFIRRHSERKKKNVLNLQVALKELQLLAQEELTNSQSPRDIVDFCHNLSKILGSDHQLIKEITSLLSNLPHAELKWLFTLEKYFLRTDHSVPNDLLSSSTPILGALMKQRTLILTESESQFLFDQEGNIKKNDSLTGRSLVTCFPEKDPEFYLKQYPEWPGYELASTLFMRLLGIQHLPYHDLLIINSKYPVLLTQKVTGNPVLRIWDNSEAFHNLDPVQTGLLIISAMLLNPEDGKEDNFILSPDGKYLIPIDNDHCFLPSFSQKEGSFWNFWTAHTTLQTKTLLFCLDEMNKPLPLDVRNQVLSIDFDLLLTKWMSELDQLENRFNNLVDQNLRNTFLEHGTVMRIPFYKQFIHNLHWKAHKIQYILSATSEITPFDLFRSVEPFAAKCYQDSFKQGNSLQNRFKSATHQLYTKTTIDGSRVSILNTRTMMEIINISEKDLQTDVMFQRMGSVDALELLNKIIQQHKQKTITECDMLCELDEKMQENKWLNLFGNPPVETALKAFFMDPKEGLILKGSKLITNSKLTELFAQAPNTGMRLRFLSLPENPLLTFKEIRILVKECPNIEYLNVSGCAKLKRIFTIEGEWPLLARLEAKDCLNLKKFVSFSPMKILRIETDQEVEIFFEKSTLDIFTISKKTKEFEFSLKKGENIEIKSRGQIMSNNDFLLRLMRGKEEIKRYFSDFEITVKINSILSENELGVFITFLDLKNSNLEAEDIQRIVQLNLINLKRLDLSKNKRMGPGGLEYLIQGHWPKLHHLDLSDNTINDKGMAILSRGNWPNINHLDLSDNAINDKGVVLLSQGNWPLVETLCLSNTHKIAAEVEIIVNQANWPHLKNVDLSNNKISDEGIETLAKVSWSLLETLNLSKTNITIAGVETIVFQPKWPQLKLLDISENPIDDEGFETLSQGNWPLLEILDLHGTNLHKIIRGNFFLDGILLKRLQITREKVLNFILNPKWPNLKKVFFDSLRTNAIENLLQKDWHVLDSLDLSSCHIQRNEIEVIASKCSWSQLKDLDLSDNPICDEGLEIIACSNWNQLEYIYLEKTGITEKGIKLLISKPQWPNLKELDISHNSIGDKGLKTLSSGKWSLLEKLSLRNTNITEKGIQSMTSISDWSKLKTLDISQNVFPSSPSRKRILFQLQSFLQTHMTTDFDSDSLERERSSIQDLVYQKWSHIRLTTSGGQRSQGRPFNS